jgi:hypothetical protein
VTLEEARYLQKTIELVVTAQAFAQFLPQVAEFICSVFVSLVSLFRPMVFTLVRDVGWDAYAIRQIGDQNRRKCTSSNIRYFMIGFDSGSVAKHTAKAGKVLKISLKNFSVL